MCQEIISHPGDFVTLRGDALKTTSLKIAAAFGKLHKDVLRKLEGLDCSPEFNGRNFALVEYTDAKGEKRPLWEMTKDGFMFLVMGFTGKKAARVKEAYIGAFNAMADELVAQNSSAPAVPVARSKVLLEMEGGVVVASRPVAADAWVGSPNEVRELLERDGYTVVPVEVMGDMVSAGASMALCHQHFMDRVAKLEQETGREWYGRPSQRALDEHPWVAVIRDWLRGREWVTSTQILTECLQKQGFGLSEKKRVSQILTGLGWSQVQQRDESGHRYRAYRSPIAAH